MNNIKKLIIILIIFIILITISLIILLSSSTMENTILGGNKNEFYDNAVKSITISEDIVLVKYDNIFFTIEKNLKNYFLYENEKNIKAIYDILEKNYLTENQITQENLVNYIDKIEAKKYEFKLQNLYANENTIYPIYYAYGILVQDENEEEKYFTIYVDHHTMSWALKPINKNEYDKNINGPKTTEEKQVERLEYNKYSKTSLNNEQIARIYFNDYIYYAIHNIQKSYSMLNEEYKTKKYSTLEKYNNYLQSKKEELITMDQQNIKSQSDFNTEEEYNNYINNLKGLKSYSIEEKEDYKQCICIDDYGNSYIFKITSPMQYDVMLDTYTIDLPEFIEEYNKSSDEDKIFLNIKKFFRAINSKDYEYAYSKLDENYKNNYFKTLNDFENYVKKNFYEQNKLSATSPESRGGFYTFKVTISDAESSEVSLGVTKSFVMKLEEGTNFVMSFSVE